MARGSSHAGPQSWSEQSDEELIMANPDRGAVVGELCRRHRTYSIKVAMGVLSNRDDAEDVVQDSFLRVHCRFDSFGHRSTFRSWLTRIVINQCRMVLRKRKSVTLLSLRANRDSPAFSAITSRDKTPEQIQYEGQLRAALWQNLNDLPSEHRLALTMRTLNGLGIGIIAGHFALTPEATRSRLHRARLALRGRLLPWISVRGWRKL